MDDDKNSGQLSAKASVTLRSALKKNNEIGNKGPDEEGAVESSPILTSTPPTVSKALVKLYPYLIVCNEVLGLLTWTGEDIWKSILMVISFVASVLYFQPLVRYFGHLLFVAVLWGYSVLDTFVEETIKDRPTLDDIVHIITCICSKADLLLSPLSVWTGNDIKRMLLTMAFLSPIYVIISLFIISSQKLVLISGVYLLTYHSSWSRVTRKLLWKVRLVRLLVFYITGLDLSGVNRHKGGIFAAVHRKVKGLSSKSVSSNDGKPIRFTYVLYENQRRWLGIGWTSNMLSYERNSWTDEFLNEAPSPEQFKLPEETSGMAWRWVDKTWRLDMTNDGAIQLPSSRPKTTAQPSQDDGFIYYDNTWKKPSTEDSFSKYTRRRRWIRTAELVKIGSMSDESFETPQTAIKDEEADKNVNPEESKGFSAGTDNKRKVSFSETKDVRIISDDDEQSEAIEESKNEDYERERNHTGLRERTESIRTEETNHSELQGTADHSDVK